MSRRRSGVLALVVCTAAGLLARDVEAQRARPREAADEDYGREYGSGSAGPDTTIVTEPVVAMGAPRSFVVVSVPVPADLPLWSDVRYTVDPTGSVTIVGRRGGTLEAGDGQRAALVTVGIPAHARAGRAPGAHVLFTSPGNPIYRVPVEIHVLPVHGITVATVGELRVVATGGRTDLRYRVRNEGNIVDTVRISVGAPEGWRVHDVDGGLLVLGPGAETEHTARLFIPGGSSTGDFFVHLDAAAGDARSRAQALVEVTDRRAGEHAGPTLRAAGAAVAGGGAPATSALSLAINGPLGPSVHADGRLVMQTDDNAVATRGFARVNSFVTPAYLTIWSPTWRMSAGSTAAGFSELTGVNGWGTGVGASFTTGSFHFGGLAARPEAVSTAGPASGLYGASWGAEFGRVRMSAAATQLRDGGAFTRELSALGVSALMGDLPLGNVHGELAYRDLGRDHGLGWAFGLTRGEAHDRFEFSYLHAPGGAAAFARARGQFTGTFNRRITPRWEVGAAVLSASDSSAALASMRSHSAALAQQFRLRNTVVLALQLRSTGFSANAGSLAPTSFGNVEHRVTASIAVRQGNLDYTAELGAESVERNADFEGGFQSEVRGVRGLWRGTAQLTTANGVAQLESAYERSTASSTYLSNQLTLAARAIRVRVSALPRDLFVDAEAIYHTWGVTRSAAMIQRAGITMPMGGGFEISAHAEHNTFFDRAHGAFPVTFAFKLERAASLPRLRFSTVSGTVFQDHNANGVRDPGEEGVGNVVVRSGEARAVTRRDGSYQFWDRTRAAISVEPGSIPHGWVVAEPDHAAGSGVDIPLLSTASLVVVFALTAESGRLPSVDLARLIVRARDARGREWLARRSASDVATFEALPPGEYTLEFDSRALAEPVHAEGPVNVDIAGGGSQRLRVSLRGRALRFYRPPAGRSAGGSDASHARR